MNQKGWKETNQDGLKETNQDGLKETNQDGLGETNHNGLNETNWKKSDKMNQNRPDEANQKETKETNETNKKGLNKPYDSAFKSIIQKCPRLALFLINEMFYRSGLISKEYDGSERVKLLNGELTDLVDGNLAEDIRLEVKSGERGIFHLECESSPGNARVMLRVVRYHARMAVDNMEMDNGCIRVRIDDSGVMFLRSTNNTPNKVTVIVEGPQGSTMSYQIPALILQSYKLESMLEKKLYILLPFLFFNYEKQLGKAKELQNYEEIKKLFNQIIEHLKQKTTENAISAYEASTLYDALKIVVEALGSTNKAKEEVERIMGGVVLEFKADKVFNEGVKKGEGNLSEKEQEWQEKDREWQEKDREWQEKEREWQEKEREWQAERRRWQEKERKQQQEIDGLHIKLKEKSGTTEWES